MSCHFRSLFVALVASCLLIQSAVAADPSGQTSPTDFWTGAAQRYKDITSLSEFQGADTQPTSSGRSTHVVSTSYSSLSGGAVLVGAVWVQVPFEAVDNKVAYTKLEPSEPNPL